MTKEIRSLVIRLATVKEIWETAKETHLVDQDASKAYQLHCEVISTQQNGGSVITYFGKLQRLWQEYDGINNCTMECTKDVEKYNKMVSEPLHDLLGHLLSSFCYRATRCLYPRTKLNSSGREGCVKKSHIDCEMA
ncbi:hypothetical protein QL285_080164 [Trifolium repens]|nr:hypothetical protein QL285_080164 [Trifolium repens]